MKKKILLSILVICSLVLIPFSAFAATTTTFLEAGSAETHDLTFWTQSNTGGTSTDSSDTTVYYNNGASIKLSTGATGGSSNIIYPVGTNLLNSGGQISFYYRTDTLPTGAGDKLLQLLTTNGGNTAVWALLLTAGDILSNAPTGPSSVAGVTTISANTWYRICVSYNITNATTWVFKVYVQQAGSNTVVLDSTANSGTLTNPSPVNFYFRTQNNIANSNAWVSNIYVTTGGTTPSSQPDTGNILVTAKRPFVNGTTNGFSTNGSASGVGTGNAEYVNGRPINLSNFVSKTGAGNTTEEYNIQNVATGDTNINGANIVDYEGWVDATSTLAETCQMVLAGNTSNFTTVAATPTLFTKVAGSTVLPTQTGSDIGMITNAANTTYDLYEAGVIIAYKPFTDTSGFFNFY